MESNRPISRFLSRLLNSPARLPIVGFAALITIGAGLLMLPGASMGHPLHLVDALFMSTSATCVTGLSVMDIGSQLSRFGQWVILALIQVGGLGIMTLSTMLLMMMKGRPTLSGQAIIKDTFTYGEGKQSVSTVLKHVFLVAMTIEGIGAVLLYVRMIPDAGWRSSAYPALFHAISAFCNAGFALFPNSFMDFRGDWVINGILSVLIVLGGIGFVVIAEVLQRVRHHKKHPKPWSLHTRLAVSASALLIVGGAAAILFMEWHNTLAALPLPGKCLAALFQSVSARTAGFNTVDIGTMANETLFLIMILMFIGACPGSCGGGIKTTTAAGLIIMGLSRMRGQRRPQVFNRTLPDAGLSKATSIVLISIVAITLAIMALMISELGDLPHTQTRGRFLELAFEAVSAFGTVGLSTGITTTLSQAGRIMLTLLMFVGRLGPLVIAVAVSRERVSRLQYAEENIMIG